jgi:predicted GNAT family acetyltransferase
MQASVVDNPQADRFEMKLADGVAYVAYSRNGNVLNLYHAEVPFALRGQGLGSVLARETLTVARGQGVKVVPSCAFMSDYMHRYPEFNDLLATL